MPRTLSVAKIERGGGKLSVRYGSKRGNVFDSVAQASAILDAFESAITDEVVFLIAARKVGLANVELLEGKTITLSLDVSLL